MLTQLITLNVIFLNLIIMLWHLFCSGFTFCPSFKNTTTVRSARGDHSVVTGDCQNQGNANEGYKVKTRKQESGSSVTA